MTAKEFLTNTFETDFLTEEEKETIITAMELFAKGKCLQQIEMCASQIDLCEDIILSDRDLDLNAISFGLKVMMDLKQAICKCGIVYGVDKFNG